jgi:pimeloyl-ACP methyl ester carboxylesterase
VVSPLRPGETSLTTVDGVLISAIEVAGDHRDVCFVVVHGFTGNWREDRVQKVIQRLLAFGSVVALDMRGHGRSGARTTLGDLEVLDVAVAVDWARELGYPRVVTVGFSLGGAVVLREAGLTATDDLPRGARGGRVDAVVAVSAPAFWYYKGTQITRVVHRLVGTRWGRTIMRFGGTRVISEGWQEPYPAAPFEAAARIDVPLLIVHGDVDRYFPLEHPRAIEASAVGAGVPTDTWLIEGLGHAETAITPELLDRIGAWARECVMGSGS